MTNGITHSFVVFIRHWDNTANLWDRALGLSHQEKAATAQCPNPLNDMLCLQQRTLWCRRPLEPSSQILQLT